jgi:putative FmdB family regulatory protein
MYTYKCTGCGFVFEELVSYEKRDSTTSCSICHSNAVRNAAEIFGVHTTLNPKTDTIYSPKEIDKVVGTESAKKWAGYNEAWRPAYEARQQKRWKGAQPKVLDIPRDADGKFSPVMHLGDNKEKSLRKEYSTALQEHRAERVKKGIGQFDAPGSIS